MNGESTSMVWPTLGSRTAKEQNRTYTMRIRGNGSMETGKARLANGIAEKPWASGQWSLMVSESRLQFVDVVL